MINADIAANARYEREVKRLTKEQKQKRDEFLRKRDEEYARLFPQNLRHGRYKDERHW